MRVEWFEIENFRSIQKSGYCYMNNGITILAGKNESGKSNILDSLVAFNYLEYKKSDYPNTLSNMGPTIRVSVNFEGEKLLQEIRISLGVPLDYDFHCEIVPKQYELEIISMDTSGEQSGSFQDLLWDVFYSEKNYWESYLTQKINQAQENGCIQSPSKDQPIDTLEFAHELLYGGKHWNVKLDEEDREEFRMLYDDIDHAYECYNLFEDDLHPEMYQVLPHFKYVDAVYRDVDVPKNIHLKDLPIDNPFYKYLEYVGYPPESILCEKSALKKKQIMNKISSEFTAEFRQLYTQEYIKVEFELKSNHLSIYFYDEGTPNPYYLWQRSKGLQWFISFFLEIYVLGLSDNDILLLDEPGAYLHSSAQKDMLNLLEKVSQKNQVIITTHSPYMIDRNKLDRVRLVIKDTNQIGEKWTRIENKVHKFADKEVLAPIITAIGYDLSQGIGVHPNLNVITEGYSDYYYLLGMMNALYPDEQLPFSVIPAVGVNQIPNIASILIGWGVNCVAMLDNDAQGRGVCEKLKSKLGFDEKDNIIFVSGQKGQAIEDLFSHLDFYKYVLREMDFQSEEMSNSKLVGNKNKILLAQNFYQLVSSDQSIVFSDETVANFQRVIKQLRKKHGNVFVNESTVISK